MNLRTKSDLLELAGRYATERRIPAATVIKEILHYEILYALGQSGAAANLTFQGGTALRLCYQGNRYSEDLDFVSGNDFEPEAMEPFSALLQKEIAEAYGLEVAVKAPKQKESSDETVPVSRWSAKIKVPQPDPSIAQAQIINIEVAGVPSYDPDLVSVNANYIHLPAPMQQMIITAESQAEILADKMVALGARPFLKARDIWDIKFLLDRGVAADMEMVAKKIRDYGWAADAFKGQLQEKLHQLSEHDTEVKFGQEMSRFVDAGAANQLKPGSSIVKNFMAKASSLGEQMLGADLDPPPQQRPRMRP